VVAQRLVRKICERCKKAYEPTEDELLELDLKPDQVRGRTFHYGVGCKFCNDSGYKGRYALFEIMVGTDRVKTAILEGKKTNQLFRIAREEGMVSLRESGIFAIYDGITTIEEVVKETIQE
jgi:type IV pilus assembly protein PilB